MSLGLAAGVRQSWAIADTRLEHQSELSALGGDVGSASDSQIAWRIFAFAFPMPLSAAKRTSQYFSKNASEWPKVSRASTILAKWLTPDFPTNRWKSDDKCPDPLDLPHLQCCHFAVVFGKFTLEIEFQSIMGWGLCPNSLQL